MLHFCHYSKVFQSTKFFLNKETNISIFGKDQTERDHVFLHLFLELEFDIKLSYHDLIINFNKCITIQLDKLIMLVEQ